MKQRTARYRRWRRWALREKAAGRTAAAGFGDRDDEYLRRRVEYLRQQDPNSLDDLDRFTLGGHAS